MASINDRQSITTKIAIGSRLVVNGMAVVTIDGASYNVIGPKQYGPYATVKTVTITGVSSASYIIDPSIDFAVDVSTDASNKTVIDRDTRDVFMSSGIASRTIASLVASYESQRAIDETFGPMLLARTGHPVAADIPTLTASATAPASDADAAAQIIYPFGSVALTDPLPYSRLVNKTWFKGHSAGLRAFQYGSSIRCASTLAVYGQNGSQDQDAALGYGIDLALITVDVILDGDVLFCRNQGDNGSRFDLYVNGHLVTAAPSTGVTQTGRYYYQTATYLKIKFSTSARRRITMVYHSKQAPMTLHTRSISTILPYVAEPLTWLHLGDSFSQYTGATDYSIGLTEWMRAAFGFQQDFINAAQGSTSFAGATMNLPGAAPVASRKASIRQQYLLHGRVCNPKIVTLLIGHNDALNTQYIVGGELSALLSEIRADYPDALIFVFTSNASPGIISSGAVVTVENTMIATANAIPGVVVFPLQTWSVGAFLRGTGYQGATNGSGNTDEYIWTDGGHPSDKGHRAYGQMMARRIYEWAKG